MTALAGLAERVSRGDAITEADAQVVLEARDLIAVGMMADEVRRRLHGSRTTFVRVLEVHIDALPSTLASNVTAGELRIVGQPPSLDAAVDAVRATAALSAGTPVTGFSLAALQQLAPASLAATCRALHSAGLEAVAEVAVDLADEDTAAAVVEARAAGLAVTRLTVETVADADRIAVMARARDLQASTRGFRVFAPLPRTIAPATPSTGYDDVKHIAVARLLAAGIESIQVDWALYGPKLAQFALTIGADDVDRISAVDPGTLGTRRSPIEEIRGNIRSASLEPVERNARYEAIG